MISALVPKVRFCVDQDLLLKVLGKCQNWLLVTQYDEFRWIMLECFGVLVSLENKFPGVDARLKFTWDYNFDFFAVASDLGRSRATYHCAYGSKQTTGSEMHARCVECF